MSVVIMIFIFKNFYYLKIDSGTSLVVQRLRLCASRAGVVIRGLTSHTHGTTNSSQRIHFSPLNYFTRSCV